MDSHGCALIFILLRFGMNVGRVVMKLVGIDWNVPAFKVCKFSLTVNPRPLKKLKLGLSRLTENSWRFFGLYKLLVLSMVTGSDSLLWNFNFKDSKFGKDPKMKFISSFDIKTPPSSNVFKLARCWLKKLRKFELQMSSLTTLSFKYSKCKFCELPKNFINFPFCLPSLPEIDNFWNVFSCDFKNATNIGMFPVITSNSSKANPSRLFEIKSSKNSFGFEFPRGTSFKILSFLVV